MRWRFPRSAASRNRVEKGLAEAPGRALSGPGDDITGRDRALAATAAKPLRDNPEEGRRLRLLSYNIQSGLSTTRYSDYLTRSWQHLIPVPSRMLNLDSIARVIADYDIVALQEVDTGSLRSGFVNQVNYLAERGGFQYGYEQTNRRIGLISQHSNAVLSRVRPSLIEERKLPGMPGRGVLRVRLGRGAQALHIFILHLALGQRSRLLQIRYLADLVRHYRYVIVMGDLNCAADSPELSVLLQNGNLCKPGLDLYTFPSWQPNRQLDHILVSPTIYVAKVAVLGHTYSDHCPIAMQVVVPESVQLKP